MVMKNRWATTPDGDFVDACRAAEVPGETHPTAARPIVASQ